jgi:hypothetical protein
MAGEGGPGTPEEFMDWAANEWPLEPIPASDAISLAGGAMAALTALGVVSPIVGQEWLETFKRRVHEVRTSKSERNRSNRDSAGTRQQAGFPRLAATMAVDLGNQQELLFRVVSMEQWPDGEIIIRFVARATRGEGPGRLLEDVALTTSEGDPIQKEDGHLSQRSDMIICGEQRFRLSESQRSQDLVLSVGETSHRIVWT